MPKAIISLGKWGEARLKQYLNGDGWKPTKPFKTSLGNRFPADQSILDALDKAGIGYILDL